MKFKIQKNQLLEIVECALKAVSRKSTTPILECIKLQVNKTESGVKLYATGNSNSFCVVKSTEVDISSEEGSVCLESKLFSEIIRKLPDGEITFLQDDSYNCSIQTGKSKFTIKGLSSKDYPAIPKVEKEKYFTVKGNALVSNVKKVAFSVAQDETRPILTGVQFASTPEGLRLAAVDGYRISVRFVEAVTTTDFEIVVPAGTLQEIIKLIDDDNDVKIYCSEKHLYIELENLVITANLLSGEFLKIEQVISTIATTKVVLSRKSLIESVERVCVMCCLSKKIPLTLDFTSKKVLLEAKAETGSSTDEVECSIDGPELKIAFNPRYLLDMLKALEDEDEIQFELISSLTPVIVKSSRYQYLVLPIRVNN